MKIAKLETFATPLVGFVRVTADTGDQGWGQISTYDADISAEVFHRHVARHALGTDPEDLETTLALIEDRELKFPGCYLRRAMGGLDTAVWDLRGKVAGKPVTALIGGSPGSLRAYGSSMRRDITPEDEAERLCRLRDEQGFTAFKWRVGVEAGRDSDKWPGRTEAIIPIVSKALGDDIGKLIDANSGFSPKRAIEVGKLAQDHGISHYEEPCPYWEYDWTRQVTEALSIDVTGGEQDCEMSAWRSIIGTRAVDVIQPDVLYLGGICRTLQVARMAAEAGIPCTPHAANHGLVTLCAMHVLRAIPNAGKYLEYSIEGPYNQQWADEFFVERPYEVRDGKVEVTDRPGWGVEVNPDYLAKCSHKVTAIDD